MGDEVSSRRDEPWYCSRKVQRGVGEFGGNATSATRPRTWSGEVVKRFHGSGHGGLVTPPSPPSLSKDSIRPMQRGGKQA
jgi:hypothetical protein